jgi:hypothetical protein
MLAGQSLQSCAEATTQAAAASPRRKKLYDKHETLKNVRGSVTTAA